MRRSSGILERSTKGNFSQLLIGGTALRDRGLGFGGFAGDPREAKGEAPPGSGAVRRVRLRAAEPSAARPTRAAGGAVSSALSSPAPPSLFVAVHRVERHRRCASASTAR